MLAENGVPLIVTMLLIVEKTTLAMERPINNKSKDN
jgi:hypothetical protein